MNRAYSLLEIKSVDEEKRIISGVATTPSADRMGDIVEPLGVKFTNPMPLLWQHRADAPVGTVNFDKPTAKGITFVATLPKIDEPGPLKDRVDTAWGEVKAGLVRATSIGFRPVEYSFMEDGGVRFVECEVLELSLVTIPAKQDATINQIRSIDLAQRAALKPTPEPDEVTEAPISAEPEDQVASDRSVRVVKLNAPARVRAPFVINRINPLR